MIFRRTPATCSNVVPVAGYASESREIKGEKKNDEKELPNFPKKPLVPYLRFFMRIRPEIMKQNPKLSFKGKSTLLGVCVDVFNTVEFMSADISLMAAAKWKECDPAARAVLQKEFAEESVNYHLEKDAMLNSLTEEQRKQLARVNAEKRTQKYNQKLKKEMSENNRPKRPAAAYLLFVADNYHRLPLSESSFSVLR